MTKEEFYDICAEIGVSPTWSPIPNAPERGTMSFCIQDSFRFNFMVDWSEQIIFISCGLCDKLHIGRDKAGTWQLDIANVEELLSSIVSFKMVYKPVLRNRCAEE